ncbi:hypothetical protein RclHR1_00140025 [Rhizophagus clarus]|uniref:Uncharacterized protein n=1 Tax=Rhizophagus clarus TaxID=94130 RepID=A0A2Z6QS23_9GLOM|nr:hypothetical protein RclHR1_00140025 [Rhizophagus clarus]
MYFRQCSEHTNHKRMLANASFRRSRILKNKFQPPFRRLRLYFEDPELQFEADQSPELHFEADHCPELHFKADHCKFGTSFQGGPLSGTPFQDGLLSPELHFKTDHCPELHFEADWVFRRLSRRSILKVDSIRRKPVFLTPVSKSADGFLEKILKVEFQNSFLIFLLTRHSAFKYNFEGLRLPERLMDRISECLMDVISKTCGFLDAF